MLLRVGFRSEDIVARWGGEEFLVANVGSTATFSAGVAAASEHGHDLGSLYHAADHALYHAKNSGRNRVAFGVSHPAT